jgi:hypothetical protein
MFQRKKLSREYHGSLQTAVHRKIDAAFIKQNSETKLTRVA